MPRDKKSFWGLILAQFLGAFNDNGFKACLLFYALSQPERDSTQLAIGAAILFVLPFVLVSTHAGRLADRFSKRSVTVCLKFCECLIMLGATVGFWYGNVYLLVVVLFLMALQSAIFSPTKYGILPEIVPSDQLPRANGLLELTTFVAIILGTVLSGLLYPVVEDRLFLAGISFTTLASFGLLASLMIAPLPAAAPDRKLEINPWPELRSGLQAVFTRREIRLTALGIAYFWSLAVVADLCLYFYGPEMGPNEAVEERTGYMRGVLGVGIGIGSLLAGYLSRRKPELGLVPIGTLGTGTFVVLLFFLQSHFGWVLPCLFLLGISGGIFLVPLNVLLQQEAPGDQKGRVIAGTNLITFSLAIVALGGLWLLRGPLGFSAGEVFLSIGLLTIALTVYVFVVLPTAFFRLLFWLFTNLIYRIRILGMENVPTQGPALLISNHVSFVDGLLVLASTHRLIRFVVYSGFAKLRGLSWLARTLRVIPISPEGPPRAIVASLKEASKALQDGELVCVFAEGQISRTGQLLPFRAGAEKILKGSSAPVIPVYLDRVWGSIFSFRGRKFFWKVPSRLPYPVTINFGKPLPPTANIHEIRQTVQELGSEAFMARKAGEVSLAWSVIKKCRRAPLRMAAVDSTGMKISNLRLLAGVTRLARQFSSVLSDEPMIGILMPPSVPTCVSNVAASLSGKPVVNFNYTVGEEALRSAAKQCGIQKVLTSRQFLDKYPVAVPGEPILIEDLRDQAGVLSKIFDTLAASVLPLPILHRYVGATKNTVDDVVTVIFSSGSTGEPKGVELTNFNILSNIHAVSQGFNFGPKDRMLGVLPFFHSTGYTVTLWAPLLVGMGVVYHPNPLDARTVGYLAKKYGCTLLIATPTFLQNYARRCEPGDFGSLRHVVVGAEKLSDAVRRSFSEKFGIEPLEGYGATECSPLVSVNVPDYRGRGVRQVGSKPGIGHPLPGVSVRIVDPETFEPRARGEEGLLLVKGPNVMRGYLGKPELTKEVLRDGWYATGDIATADEDGFLTLTGRLARFAKIGGEMVPCVKVEEALLKLLGIKEQTLVVTSVPDPRKGERLIVVHVLSDDQLEKLLRKIPESGLPNLWIPRSDAFVRVDAIPILGTGKVDLRKVREIAQVEAVKEQS